MKKRLIYFAGMLLVLSAFMPKTDPEIYFHIPEKWPKPLYDFSKNPLSADKINLGRALFYDPLLSKNNTISCASCHSPYTAFTHVDHKLSHGIDDKIGTRNAPTLMNLAWNKFFMWDGSVHHLDAQALAPMNNPMEMNETLEHVIGKLKTTKLYPKLYYQAYGDSTITGQQTLQAISQFMLTLVSDNSKYDKVMRKENGVTFTESETRGYQLFKLNCATCHREPLFTNGEFENNGLEPDPILNDIGRAKVTLNPKDSLRFKVPSLRNVELTSPYMHDGRYPNLEMVLFHYTNNIHNSKTLSKPLLKKIVLSEGDKRDLIRFMKTLTDEDFVNNKKFAYPREIFLK